MYKFSLLLFLFLSFQFVNAADDYWQQKVDYNISVSLDAVNKTLEGSVQISYQNNADHHLDTIWIHLWPNAYSRHNTALAKQFIENGNIIMDVLDREDLGAIGKLEFKVNGSTVYFHKLERDPDISYIVLNEPILPNEKILITTPFKVKVPAPISRMGTEDGYFAVTQWYPKVAVYDKNGWHEMPYLDQGEFYNEFGDYEVEITVPETYVVAATGVLSEEHKTDSSTTYFFKQENIHDFAWFASPDFKIKEDKAILKNGKEVAIKTYYLTDEQQWHDCNTFTKKAVEFFSELIGPYPYDHCTVVEGPLKAGGGMEYPMITILDNDDDITRFESVVAHEVVHNYWQGILASNERSEPWIDEGFASYYEKRYNNEIAINEFKPETLVTERRVSKLFGLSHLTYDEGEEILMRQEERMNRHQPVGGHAEDFTYFNYFISLYVKAPHLIQYLENYLGRSQFDDCIRSFYENHKFQHIHSIDIQSHFETCSGKDLSFLFDDWINTDGIVNGKISKVKEHDEKLTIEIKQTGEVIVPLPVTIVRGETEEIIWVEAAEETSIDIDKEGVDQILLDKENISMDHDPSNNFYKMKGIGKLEKLKPYIFGSIENNRFSQRFVSPMIAGNTHDKFMLGLSFYNRVYPAKNWELDITPLYAFGSKQVNGIFNTSYAQNIRKDRKVQIKYGVHFKTFSYTDKSFGGRYLNVRPTVDVKILPKNLRKNFSHNLNYVFHVNWKEFNIFDQNTNQTNKTFSRLCVHELGYRFEKKHLKVPVNAAAKIQFNHEHAKLTAETNFKVRYGKVKSYFSGRVWTSAILAKKTNFAGSKQLGTNYQTNLSGRSGSRDYLFEDYYLGRTETMGFVSRQLVMNEGQFKFLPTTLGDILNSNILAASINLRADFPSKYVPIKLYADIGIILTEAFSSGGFITESFAVIQAGIMLSLIDEAFEVYFPMISTGEIKDYYKTTASKYKQRITFSLNLNKLNPHKRVKELEF